MENSPSSGTWAPLQTDRQCPVTQSSPTLCGLMDCSPQAPLFMEFPMQEFWSGVPFPTPGDLPDPGMEIASLVSPHWQGDSSLLAPLGKDWRQEKGLTEDEMVRLKEETEQALSWKQDSILGQTVDFELYAQYWWKRHTNLKTRPLEGRAPGLSIA